MAQVHYDPSDGLFKAWIGGVLTIIPIVGSGSFNGGINSPLLIDEPFEPFEPYAIQQPIHDYAYKPGINVFTGQNSFSQLVDLLSGQIKFPSTQNASADVNTLDDYEEGVWTPVIGGTGGTSGQTYDWQQGYYVKIGKSVALSWDAKLTNKGTITGNARISGLPFVIEDVNRNYPQANMGLWNNLAVAQVHVSGYGERNTTYINLLGAAVAVTSLAIFTTTEIANTTQFIGTLIYRATA